MQANGQRHNPAAFTTGNEHLATTGQKARSVAQPDWTPRVNNGTNFVPLSEIETPVLRLSTP